MDPRNARSRALAGAALLAGALLSSGCLVLSLQPAYTGDSIEWNQSLLGRWKDAEDNVEVTIERGEWRSYRVHYTHPVDELDFTGHLTAIGDTLYLDLMPHRGQDFGPVLIPAHLIVRLRREGNAWLVSAIDYDRARAALKTGGLAGVASAPDQRQNVVLTAATPALRDWLRARSAADFGAAARFEKVP